jgi:hypothetical protein
MRWNALSVPVSREEIGSHRTLIGSGCATIHGFKHWFSGSLDSSGLAVHRNRHMDERWEQEPWHLFLSPEVSL